MEKKLLALIMCVVMVIGSLPVYAFAEDGLNDWTYRVLNEETKTASVIGYTGTETEITIPEEINGYSIVRIGKEAFRGNRNIIKVFVPDSVTAIYDAAFYGCLNMVELRLPTCLKSIGKEAFYNCRSIDGGIYVNVPVVGDYAFSYCKELKTVEFGESVKKIGVNAFEYCIELESVDFNGHNALAVCENAFADCFMLKSFEYEVIDKAKYDAVDFGTAAFSCCTSLENVCVNKVGNIGDYAFSGCEALKSFKSNWFSNSIGESAFEDCSALEEVEFGAIALGLNQTIGDNAFRNCNSLKSFVFPRGITQADSCVFENCTSLESVFICENTIQIQNNYWSAFRNCPNLTTVYGYSGTYAEDFANNNGYVFVPVSNGDINDDGEVTIADYTITKTIIDGSMTDVSTYQRNVADNNQDVSIDAFDLFQIDKTINA